MSEVIINIYPAKGGDAFLINFSNDVNIVIDMGYENTYINYIEEDLKQIKEKGKKINLLIISHIDEDHIQGAIEFFRRNTFSDSTKIVDVDEVWHNSYRHLQLDKQEIMNLDVSELGILEEIKSSNSLQQISSIKEDKKISAYQGSTLASYLYAYQYKWNSLFENNAINYDYKDEIEVEGV